MTLFAKGAGRFVATAALFAALASGLRAETTYGVPTDPGSKTIIRISTPLGALPQFGFMPVRVFVENLSASDGEWQFKFFAGIENRPPGQVVSNLNLAVPTGQSRESWFYIPIAESGIVATTVIGAPGSSFSSGPSSVGPPQIPGVNIGSITSRTNLRTNTTTDPTGMIMERTFIYTQTGPAASLPVLPPSALPPRTTMTATTPNVAGEVTRTTTAVVAIVTGGVVVGARGGRGGGGVVGLPAPSTGPGSSELAARRLLAGSGLLDVPALKQMTMPPLVFVPTSGGSRFVWVAIFVQTGKPSDFPVVPASLPPGVVVNDHASATPGEIKRTITYIDPGDLAAYYAAPISPRPGALSSFQISVTRLELVRLGFALDQPGVRVTASSVGAGGTQSVIFSTGAGSTNAMGRGVSSSSGTGPTTVVVTETGLASLLPPVPATSKVGDFTVTVNPGGMPGEVVRNFVTRSVPSAPIIPPGARVLGNQTMAIGGTVAGPGVTGPGSVFFGGLFNGSGGMLPLAVSPGLEAPLRNLFTTSGVRGIVNLSPIDPMSVPSDWRIWSSFRAVVLRASEYNTLDVGHRNALQAWIGLGGQLVLEPDAAGTAQTVPFGVGVITTLATPIADISASATEVENQFDFNLPVLSLPERPAQVLKGSNLGEEILDEGPGSTWLVVFLLSFVVISGPINLWWFARKSNRHRLFWTTPVLAIAGSIVLVATILLQDGLGGTGRQAALVVLLPGLNQAAVFQEQAARTGFLAKRTFTLGSDAILAKIDVEEVRATDPKSSMTRNANEADGDWFHSRSREAHLLRRIAPTRGRVEVLGTGPGGAPIVESSLATIMKGFMFSDANGLLWTTNEVAPGHRVTLTPAPDGAKLNSRPMGGSAALTAVYNQVAQPAPGRWFGWGGATDLAPIATLANIRWREGYVAYTGIAEAPQGAAAQGGAR